MKKIISFSLWGDNPKYTFGAIENAKLVSEIYGEEWIGRFYCCATSVPKSIIDKLKILHSTEVVLMQDKVDWRGLFWRFYPASEKDVEIMLSRDTDSRLSSREKEAVDEWLQSKKKIHIMRDHPYHTTQILGGMWGCRRGVISNIKELIKTYKAGDYWQSDQEFLRDIVYSLIKTDCFVHDSFFNYDLFSKKFPIKQNGNEFVGQVYDENNIPDIRFTKIIEDFRNIND